MSTFGLIATILDFCTPLVSGTTDQCTVDLRDSDKGSVAVTIVFVSAVEVKVKVVILEKNHNFRF